MRRIGSVTVSALVAGAVLVAPQAQARTSEVGATEPSVVLAKKVAKPSKACRKRLANPSKVVPAKRFGKCVVKGMLAGRTAKLNSTYSDGTSNKGDARFAKRYTETSARYSDGSRLVILGGSAWYKPVGHGWVRAKKGGNTWEQTAWNIERLWSGLSSANAYKHYLGASSTGWAPTKRDKRINGVSAREYVGTVVLDGMAFDDYRVWVDKWDRPIRIDSTLTIAGMTSTGRQDFKKWGGKVSIVAPKIS